MTVSGQQLRIAVLLSGSGRTLENLIDCKASGALDIEIPLVIASRSTIRGVEVARSAGIETHVITRRDAPTPAELSRRVKALTDQHAIDLMLLAGYLMMLDVIPEWRGKILNIHPSLLPLFGGQGMYGRHVHEAVLASGMRVSGCTTHIVTAEYDSGPIVAQRCVPVMPDDDPESLGGRVFEAECQLYPETLRLFIDGRVQIQDGRVQIATAE